MLIYLVHGVLGLQSQVWSTELPKNILSSADAANQQVAFDATMSSTFKKLDGETWKISYGDSSSASGDVGTDVVNLGGLKVEGQAVELAKELSQQFAQVRLRPKLPSRNITNIHRATEAVSSD
jgi:hypothetical protein